MATLEHMDGTEIGRFLESQSTGTLALASGDNSYAVPVSYAYDSADGGFYFRLGFAAGSQKQEFINSSEYVSFVVYEQVDGAWNSVVAEGRLERITDSRLDTDIEEAVRGLSIPYFQVHERPATDLEFGLYRLKVTKLTGIVEGSSAD